jgi:DNA polymerase-4
MTRTILHVDMDAFFASVELLRRPELHGRPVVVGGNGDPTRRGVVSTATYEARRFGIHSGMPLRTAARLCPDAVFLPVDFNAYRAASDQVFEEFHRITDRIEAVGLDEAYLDVTALQADPVDLARELKAAIRARTRLVASVGIGPNRLLAKIASDLEKPDGLTRLAPEDVPRRVWPLGVRVLHGVGPRTAERLAELDIAEVGELAEADIDSLCAAFGERRAHQLRRLAHGEDDRPVSTARVRKSIGRERTFQQDCRSSRRLEVELERMLAVVVESLRRRRLQARTVTVKIRYRDFVTNTRSRSLPRATDDETLLQALARECLYQHTLHRAVRLLGVQVGQLGADVSCNA